MNFANILWLIVIIYALIPTIKQWKTGSLRFRMLERIEKNRKSRAITLIHRQESFNLLGIPITRYINIEDSEEILRAIRLTPDEVPIDLILHTPGGLVLAAEQIALAILKHPGKVTVFVPHYAMSGGTLLALAADQIVLDQNAVLGPIDPQLGTYPAVSILKVIEKKDINEVDDKTLIWADVAQKAMRQVKSSVSYILKSRNMPEEKAEEVAQIFTEGRWTHDYPITGEELEAMGLDISYEMPREVYALMELYPQFPRRRPSVQYIPVPYQRRDEND